MCRLVLSAAKPNSGWHASLGFVALLLNPTYVYRLTHVIGARAMWRLMRLGQLQIKVFVSDFNRLAGVEAFAGQRAAQP